jgi:hypothetical protein
MLAPSHEHGYRMVLQIAGVRVDQDRAAHPVSARKHSV